MQILQYPFVIITALAACSFVMGIIGLYFTMKSVKTANGTAEKDFCSLGKIENDFEKTVKLRKNCCVVYISLSLDGIKRIYPESSVMRMYKKISDILLQQFCVYTYGEISYYGKNGFVALNHLIAEEAESKMDKCFHEIGDILVENKAVNLVRLNFGYHCTSSSEVSFKVALARAKQACSMAEENDVLYCRWDNSKGKKFERKLKMENNILNEIENNRFFLEYQPIIDCKNGAIVGAEVLSRLNSATDGILSPNTFLSAVNNVGLHDKFDYYIFEKNCKWVTNDKENRGKYFFTINFSRATFSEVDFADTIIKIVEDYGCSYSNLALEILEDKNLSESELRIMIDNLKRLKEKGVLILLDDFGKGYTSFGDLSEFAIDIVKIDKAITQGVETNAGYLILKNIIKTAHDLGIKTLCEGIETEKQRDIAIEVGADMLQGFYLYRPMPVVKLENLLKENEENKA